LCLLGLTSAAAAERPAPDPAAGRAAYDQYCARCHGLTGSGDGVDAKRFYPRPRDLKLGVYKFRSTASGTPPTDEDLFQTLAQGLPGSNMPDWQFLSEATRWQLVHYLKSLSPVFEATPSQPLALPPDPGAGHDRARGQALYQELGCATCHGAQGRANGRSAAGLVDDWGMKIRPADLTQGWAYRGGATPKDILTRLMAGIDGAGMPSYAEAITPVEDAWHLAYYVASLQEPARWHMGLKPAQIAGALPSSVEDPRWRKAPMTTLRLRNVVDATGAWVEPPTVRAVTLQAMANREAVVWHLIWHDPSPESGSPPDGLAVVLQPAGTEGDNVTLHAWPYAGSPALDVCYWNAQDQTAGEFLAKDIETIRGRRAVQTSLLSQATYAEGRWHLLLERPLHAAQVSGGALLGGQVFNALAVMIWDAGEPGAQSVSAWIDLDLRQPSTGAAASH
jgi:cytochrome c oxidase cbb3-type subunit 2